jgi:hypothetical protein
MGAGPSWEELGPALFAGRSRAEPNTLYACFAGMMPHCVQVFTLHQCGTCRKFGWKHGNCVGALPQKSRAALGELTKNSHTVARESPRVTQGFGNPCRARSRWLMRTLHNTRSELPLSVLAP